jgi:diaminohydroxyphosphoribosylaminopyrimidine deaminase / 5-amino-6-(5-phosphoribosylamino)uracil reductase
VVAVADPNPRVIGGGASALRDAGVDVLMGCLEADARAANRVFFTAMKRGRPHVTLKWAMTLDGKIAAFDRGARWITGEPARAEAHRLRSVSDAVVVGIGTVLADDPGLDVRLPTPWPREPLRVVVDSTARLPTTARIIGAGSPARVVVAVADAAPDARVARLVSLGVTVLACKSNGSRVDVSDLAAQLYAMDVMGMLVEGGSALHASFVEAGLVDRVAVFVAPKLIGGTTAPTAVGGRGLRLPDALRLDSPVARPVGEDWLIEGDVGLPGGEGQD